MGWRLHPRFRVLGLVFWGTHHYGYSVYIGYKYWPQKARGKGGDRHCRLISLVGGLEGWKVEGLEGWKVGGLEGWRAGGLEG